ncbi:MAG TPA: hypothetical protein VM262_18095 [Acidimicrobiales bacterium]|nr:hypothetical protein [Acidimicrobiales bacterium]
MQTELPAATDRRVEDWFISRGLPHLIPGYSASRDVLTRAAPLLAVVFLLECVLAVEAGWPWWLNVLAASGGFAVAVAAWAGLNRLRGRPAFARPGRVGGIELAVFVLVPGLTRMVLHGSNPLTTVAGNVGLVVAIYAGTSYAVVPLARWALVRLARQSTELVGLVARALPLLLLFIIVLFLNAEVWQLAGALHGPSYWLTISLFAVVGIAFMCLRVPLEVAQLARFDDWRDVRAQLAGTPLDADQVPAEGDPEHQPLSVRERWNAMLVLVFSQAVQTLAVVVMIGGFLTLFGVLAMQPDTIATYAAGEPNLLAEFRLLGERNVSEELLRVVGFLSSFSGFYFTVVGLTDKVYRDEFVEDVLGEIRQALAVRTAHRLLRRKG